MTISQGYNPNFDIDLEQGQLGEELVHTVLSQNSGITIEVKTDRQSHQTGNFYIETHQFSRPDKSDIRPSGISVTTADFWAFATPHSQMFLMIPTSIIREVIADEIKVTRAQQPIANENTNGSIGYLVEVAEFLGHGKLSKPPYPKL